MIPPILIIAIIARSLEATTPSSQFSHFNGGVEMITGGGPTVCRINGELDFTRRHHDREMIRRHRFGNYYAIDPDTAMDLRNRK